MNAKLYLLPSAARLFIALSIIGLFSIGARAQVACVPPPTGLVSWWSFDGNAADQLGVNSGTLGGNPAFGAGKVAGALLFDGTDDEVVVPPSLSLNVGTGGGFTVEGWIKPQNPNQQQPILEWNNRQGTVGVMLWLSLNLNGDLYANVIDSGNVSHDFYSPAGLVTTSDWYHLALTYNRATGEAVIYLNGNAAARQDIGSFPVQTSFELFFGRRINAGGGSAWFAGLMDEWGLYNRSLNPAEVQAIFNAGSAGKCKNPVIPPPACMTAPSGLVAWWPWNETASEVVSGSNAVLFGSPAYFPGQVGSALRFDGPDDAARIAATPALDVGAGSGLTVEAWIRPENVQTPGALLEWSSTNGDLGVHFYLAAISTGSLFANLIDTNNTPHFFTTPPGLVVTGQWQHVALTYDRTGGVARLFLNGTSVVQQTMGSFRPQTRSDLQIGQRAMGGVAYQYRGGLDELSLYDRALTATQIGQIARAGSGGKCQTNGPVPSTSLRVVSVTAPTDSVVSVPIEIGARGNENALSFSLDFNPSLQAFRSATPRAGLAGVTLIVNSNDAGAGRLGFALALPASAALPAGTQELMRVEFQVGSNPGTGSVAFGDSPVSRQVADALAHSQPADTLGGALTVTPGGFEADVAPRPRGDGAIAAIDWVQVGRFVANIDTPTTGEFVRVDCAPRATGGNGMISAADFVQAGRYLAALDPLTPAGGPAGPAAGGIVGFQPAGAPVSQLSTLNVDVSPGATFVVPVQLQASGRENAFGFSIVFDPSKMSIIGVAAGADAASASLTLNTILEASGKLGVLLGLPAGQSFFAGSREVLLLSFVAAGDAAGNSRVSFGDDVVLREVADVNADVTSASFVSGTVTFGVVTPPGPLLSFARTGDLLLLAWPGSAAGYQLEGTSSALGSLWTTISSFTLGEQKMAIVPITGGGRYLRLRKL